MPSPSEFPRPVTLDVGRTSGKILEVEVITGNGGGLFVCDDGIVGLSSSKSVGSGS